VETLLGARAELYDITVFGTPEPYGHYNPHPLRGLDGEKRRTTYMLNHREWYDDNGIPVRKGRGRSPMIDRRTCEVVTADGLKRAI